MHAGVISRGALALAVFAVCATGASAGGGGHGGGPVFHPGGAFHGGFGSFHGAFGGAGRPFGARGLPPVSGIIHERAGVRPYISAYGHTNTAARFGGFGRGGVPGYGHTATGLPGGGFRPYAGGYGGYGHVGTGLRYGSGMRAGALGEGRRRFAERRGFGRYGGFAGGGYGGFAGGYGYGGGYGAPGIYGDAGVYGGQGTYGNGGTYGAAGTYGGDGTYATQSVYGNGGGVAYRSETPLAARFAEPPLGPSPYAAYSPDDRYAYAASEDVGPGPRVLRVPRSARRGCDCGAVSEPMIYRYGVGTAY